MTAATPRRTLGEYVALLLERYDVRHVFGIPGVHNVEIYRGLPQTGIRHITPRHEQGAGFMADGYARVTGRPGACFVITGPGLTNILTAMGQAYADSIPMLVISTVNPLGRMGSGDGWLHEMTDQNAAARTVAAFSHRVTSVDEVPAVFARAFASFTGRRPRPVHVDIPVNLLGADASHLALPHAAPAIARPAADPEAIEAAAAVLATARAPVILVGGGARGAGADLARLAETLDAPVCMTANARGLLPSAHPLAVSWSPSLAATRQLIAASDVVLAVGTELGPTDYDAYDVGGFATPGRLIRVDIDPVQLTRRQQAEIGIAADARATLAALAARIPAPGADRGGPARVAAVREAAHAELSPVYRRLLAILDTVAETLPGVTMVGDSTQLVYAGNLGFGARHESAWFSSATGFGTLGYGLPAAVGASLGLNDGQTPPRPVLALVGDGGLQFTLGELGSAIDAGVPLILLVWNNRGYGEIKSYMRERGIATLGVDLHTPDMVALARAYGWAAERLAVLDELPAKLHGARARGGCTLIEIDEAVGLAGA